MTPKPDAHEATLRVLRQVKQRLRAADQRLAEDQRAGRQTPADVLRKINRDLAYAESLANTLK